MNDKNELKIVKRSEINKYIQEAIEFFKRNNWHLPPFSSLSLEEWKEIINNPHKKEQYTEIITKSLGWDVTDFGSGNFLDTGLTLFTLRNGSIDSTRSYCEKIMLVRENQKTPFHYHWDKTEDIINRSGGNLMIDLYHAASNDNITPDGEWREGIFDEENDVQYEHDGIKDSVKSGGKVTLKPGESITLPPRLYHQFYGEVKKGWVMVGEVSHVNDDEKDNRFQKKLPRYTPIIEDEKPRYLLCNEYEKAVNF